MQTYPTIREKKFVEAYKSLTLLEKENTSSILSNLISRRIEEVEQLLCLSDQTLPKSLQKEVLPISRFILNVGIIVPKSSRHVII